MRLPLWLLRLFTRRPAPRHEITISCDTAGASAALDRILEEFNSLCAEVARHAEVSFADRYIALAERRQFTPRPEARFVGWDLALADVRPKGGAR